MAENRRRWVVAFALIASCLVVSAIPVTAAGSGLVVGSQHTDFGTATETSPDTVQNLTTTESGDSAFLDLIQWRTFEDFDDGDTTINDNDWSGWTGDTDALTAQQNTVLSGSWSAELTASAGTFKNVTATRSAETPRDLSVLLNTSIQTGVSTDKTEWRLDDASGTSVTVIRFRMDGNIRVLESGGFTTIGSGWSANTTYNVSVEPDYDSQQFTVVIDGGQYNNQEFGAFDMQNSVSGVKSMRLQLDGNSGSQDGSLYFDDVTQTFAPATGQYISATHSVSNASEAAINLTLENATADVRYEYHDGSSWVLGNSSTFSSTGNQTLLLPDVNSDTWRANITFTNSAGVTTAELHDESILFTNHAPTGSNLQPSDGTKLSQSEVDFSIDVNDTEFPTTQGDSVDAELFVDGSSVGTKTVTANGTVTITETLSEGGDHTYHWTLSDSYGETTTTSTNTVSVPSTLYIYNETTNSTGQHELLDDTSITITATVTGSNQTVFETTVDNGQIDFSGLDADETYVITLESEDFYTREVYVASIYDQEAVFLLNTTIASVRNDLSVTDRTGRYSDNPTIVVDRVINTSNVTELDDNGYQWVAIGGDRLGASGVYTIDLQEDARYRFRVINQDDDTRVLGEYTAKSGGSINLEIGSISYDLSPDDEEYEWTTKIENTSSGGSITFSYNDSAELTTRLDLTIKYRDNGTVFVSETFDTGPYGEITYVEPISQSAYDNESFIIEWNATRNGTQIDGKAYEGSRQEIDLPLSNIWMQVGYAALIFVFAFLVGAGVSAAAGSLVVISFSGFGWYIGIVPSELGAGAIILGLMIAAIQHMLTQQSSGVR